MAQLSESVRSYYDAYTRHDLDALLAMLAEDVEIRFPTNPTPTRGKERIQPAWTLVFSTVIPDVRQRLRTVVTEGQTAACELIESGTLTIPRAAVDALQLDIQPGPRPYQLEMASIHHYDDTGLIDRIRSYWDTGSMAEQIGVGPNTLRLLQAHAHALS